MARVLLENGADVNMQNMQKTAPIEEAISQRQHDLVSLLYGKSRIHEGNDADTLVHKTSGNVFDSKQTITGL